MAFIKATKEGSYLRMALTGASGSGKTLSALKIASSLAKAYGGGVAVLDTERGSARKYSDIVEFDVDELTSFEAEHFTRGIKSAVDGGYKVLVVDSLSHAWMGEGGILEFVDEVQRRNKGGNSFTAWRDATPQHNRIINAILQSPIHIICTMRSKQEYVMETVKGKQVPRKIGMAPVQRADTEYEYDIVGDMDEGRLVVSKTRCSALDGKSFHHPGDDIADIIREWLGDNPVLRKPEAPTTPQVSPVSAKFKEACEGAGINPIAAKQKLMKNCGVDSWAKIPEAAIKDAIAKIEAAAGASV